MAKFKVGDIVKDKFGSRLKVVKVSAGDQVVVAPVDPCRDGETHVESEKYLVVANSASTNPVVANALAATARNGINDWFGFRRGDKVRAKYWKNPNAVGIVTGLASIGKASDGSDTFLSVDFPTEKNVSCSIKELVKNSTAANAGVRAGLQKLLHSLSRARTDIGASLGKFNEEDWGDELAWAQKVNRACDDVAHAINNAVRILGS